MTNNKAIILVGTLLGLLLLPCVICAGEVANMEVPPSYDFQPLIDTPEFAECWAEWERFYQREGLKGESRACARWNIYDECVYQVDNDAPDYPGRPIGCMEL